MKEHMTLGYIGLGKMGKNMVLRLNSNSINVIGFNRSKEVYNELNQKGISTTNSIEEVVDKLPNPKVVWLMVPHQAVDDVIFKLSNLLDEGDIIVDGGNSNYKDSIKRYKTLKDKNISFIDCGVSGGPEGALNGACLMVGGNKEDFEYLEPLFKIISNGKSYKYMGKNGAGHFVKMVHNGIEYGMMQSIAEGFQVLKASTEFDIDLIDAADIYNQNSVIESNLIGLTKKALEEYGQNLDEYSGKIAGLGEGKWTVDEANDQNIQIPVIEKSVKYRETSPHNPRFIGKLITALREQFGGRRKIR